MTLATTPRLLDELDREWKDLLHSRSFAEEFARIIARYPQISALATTTSAPRMEPAEADVVLHGLLCEYQRGSYPAGRIVLQCMLPAVKAIVRRSRRHDDDVQDLVAQSLAAMWEAVTAYDLSQRSRVAMRLQGAVLTAVVGDRAPHNRRRRRGRGPVITEVPTDGGTLAILPGAASSPQWGGRFSQMSASLGVVGEVLDVIAWAVEQQVITSDDGALLARVYAPDPGQPEYSELLHGRGVYQEAVAKELGISHAALRKRASRAVRKIAQAVHHEE